MYQSSSRSILNQFDQRGAALDIHELRGVRSTQITHLYAVFRTQIAVRRIPVTVRMYADYPDPANNIKF